MPGRSISSANSSTVHLNDSRMRAGDSGIPAYIFPPILNTRSSPHITCSVVCGSEMQCARIQSMLISVRRFQLHDRRAGPAFFLLSRIKLRHVRIFLEQIRDRSLKYSHTMPVHDAHSLHLRQCRAVE